HLCAQCHIASKYDSPKHSFHKIGNAGAQCVSCHMPSRTYMVIDQRRDHSIRVPRPDLSTKLSTPDACTNCHVDKSPRWAADQIREHCHSLDLGFQASALALAAGREGAPTAETSLVALFGDSSQPAIARASSLAMLGSYPPASLASPVRAATQSDSSLIRR